MHDEGVRQVQEGLQVNGAEANEGRKNLMLVPCDSVGEHWVEPVVSSGNHQLRSGRHELWVEPVVSIGNHQLRCGRREVWVEPVVSSGNH